MPTVRRHKRSRTVRHKYDYDRMTKNLVIFIVWLAVLLIPIAYFGARYFNGLTLREALDMAQIAKQKAIGYGFVSGYATPAVVELTGKIIHSPEIVRPPLFIWILSFFPGVSEGSDVSVSTCSSLFFVLTGILIFQFARMVTDFSKAIIVSIIYLLSIPMLGAAISGLPYTLTAFLFLILCILIYIDSGKSFLLSFLIGMVAGGVYLSDYHFLPVIVPVALCVLYERKNDRWRFLALFLIGFAAITLPWILRNYGMGLNPFIGFPLKYRAIMGAPNMTPNVTFGTFGLAKLDELYSHAAVYRKVVANLLRIYNGFMLFGGILMALAFIASIFIAYRGLAAVRMVVYSSIVLVSLAISADDGNIAGLTPLLPMIIFLAVTGLYRVIDKSDSISDNVKLWVIRVFIVLNILPFVGAIARAPNPRRVRMRMEKSRLVMEELGSVVGGQEIVITDEPWRLSWYSAVPSVLLPEEKEDYQLLVDSAGDFKFAYLTSSIADKPMRLWSAMFLSRSVPSWFPLREGHVLSDKSLILSDRKRW